MVELVKFIPLFPLIGFLLVGIFGKYLKKEYLIGTIASGAVGLSLVFSVIIFSDLLSNPHESPYVIPVFTWLQAGDFSVNISYQVDQLSILFSLIVTLVGFLIHVYSIGYMHGDRSFYRFFAYMNLFIFMMLNLVLSSNYLLTFLGWEGVGLCSYLLIGFWYDKKFEGHNIVWTGDAGNKAFIVNRIGDFGFLIAMFLIFVNFSSLEYTDVLTSAASGSQMFYNSSLITIITLLMFLGCTGKSAQIPLAVWLPDAMAGPTPVSALIHAATMVTAGVFLIARNSVLYALAPISMEIVMIIGILTAFTAASIGIVQNDFKKVLAYSTVSQLGFMFAALGAGAFNAGVFHVMTHAFFKGLLFLAAGAVIHGIHEEQNIKKMGGLKKYMPVTYFTFFVATLAISGIPFFSGFFSKDEILWYAYSNGGWFAWLILISAAFFTAFYMFRLLKLVFQGKERFDIQKLHPHEAPKTMLFALVTLAFLSALGGFLGVPEVLGSWFSNHPNLLHSWLTPVFSDAQDIIIRYGPIQGHASHLVEYLFMLISIGIAVGAIFLAKKMYDDQEWSIPRKLAKSFKSTYLLLWNKYYLDNLYHNTIVNPLVITSRNFLWRIFDVKIIDGFVNGLATITNSSGEVIKRIQSGIVQNYATLMVGGIIIILACLMIG
jgi:NADH-quinone oxidoreductase subunit L